MTPPWRRGRSGRAPNVMRRRWRPGWTADEWRVLERQRAAGRPWAAVARRLKRRSAKACRIAWCRYGPSPEYHRLQAYLALVRRAVREGLELVQEDPELLARISIEPKSRRKSPKEVAV